MYKKIYDPVINRLVEFPSGVGIKVLNNYLNGGGKKRQNSGQNKSMLKSKNTEMRQKKYIKKMDVRHQNYTDKVKKPVNFLLNNKLADYHTKIYSKDLNEIELMKVYDDSLQYLPKKYEKFVGINNIKINKLNIFLAVFTVLSLSDSLGSAAEQNYAGKNNTELLEKLSAIKYLVDEHKRTITMDAPCGSYLASVYDGTKDPSLREWEVFFGRSIKDITKVELKKIERQGRARHHPDTSYSKRGRNPDNYQGSCNEALTFLYSLAGEKLKLQNKIEGKGTSKYLKPEYWMGKGYSGF